MKTNYLQYLCDTYMPGVCMVHVTLHGIRVETPYLDRLVKFLKEQTPMQFEVCRDSILSGVNVSLNRNVKTVCKTCGSPEFLTKQVKKYTSYVEPTHFKVKTLKMITTTSQTTCIHCKAQHSVMGKALDL